MPKKLQRFRKKINTHPVAIHKAVILSLLVFSISLPLTLIIAFQEPRNQYIDNSSSLSNVSQPVVPACHYVKLPCQSNNPTCDTHILVCPDGQNNTITTTQTDNSQPVGLVDSADCQKATGWAYTPQLPFRVMYIQLYDNGPLGVGRFLGTILANLKLDDNDVIQIFGNHEFYYPVPAFLKDGKLHSLYAYAYDASSSAKPTLLVGSPKILTCLPQILHRSLKKI